MAFHTNQKGILCAGCQTLFKKYPGFYLPVRLWFEGLQLKHPELHISCAGRGRIAQELYFKNGESRAHYGESAHNWNAAIDVFFSTSKNQYDLGLDLFNQIIVPNLPDYLKWYGAADAKFKERPHIELRDWHKMRDVNLLKIVEVT